MMILSIFMNGVRLYWRTYNMNFCQCMRKLIVSWNAEYKGSSIVVDAIDPWGAQKAAAIELGVPLSREKHIVVKKVML